MSKINAENKAIWDANADYWNENMGSAGNNWHRELISPPTIELLNLRPQEKLLDIGCGNGVFSRTMSAKGISVTAFDFSEANIKHAKTYTSENIEYLVLDATRYEDLIKLGKNTFDGAVANMVLMDTPEIDPLFKAVAKLLKNGGVFVFSVSHPCFNSDESVMIEEDSIKMSAYHHSTTFKGEAIRNQPQLQYYFHRSISDLLEVGFRYGFVVDGMKEPVFEEGSSRNVFTRIPPVLIVRMRNTP